MPDREGATSPGITAVANCNSGVDSLPLNINYLWSHLGIRGRACYGQYRASSR
jgi:hypothetical protein